MLGDFSLARYICIDAPGWSGPVWVKHFSRQGMGSGQRRKFMYLTVEGSVGTPELGHAKDASRERPKPRPGWSWQVWDFAAI